MRTMINGKPDTHANPENAEAAVTEPAESFAERCRRRMLEWPNPVEYVNDMYGCHPGEGDTEYFRRVFGQ